MYKVCEVHDNWLEELVHTEHKEHLSNKELKNLYERLSCKTIMVTDTKTKKTVYIWKSDKDEITIYE